MLELLVPANSETSWWPGEMQSDIPDTPNPAGCHKKGTGHWIKGFSLLFCVLSKGTYPNKGRVHCPRKGTWLKHCMYITGVLRIYIMCIYCMCVYTVCILCVYIVCILCVYIICILWVYYVYILYVYYGFLMYKSDT